MTAGSATAIKHLPTGRGRSFSIFGSILTFKDEPQGGAHNHLTFEHRELPNSSVPPHREPSHESWYVLEGTLEVDVEGAKYQLGSGDFLAIPPGTLHSLHNPGPGPMRVLTTVSPGDAHVRLFTAVGQPVDDGLPLPKEPAATDPRQLASVARECGIEFLPPGER